MVDESPQIFESVAVSSDDRTIAAGCRDGTVLIYRTSPRTSSGESPWGGAPDRELGGH